MTKREQVKAAQVEGFFAACTRGGYVVVFQNQMGRKILTEKFASLSDARSEAVRFHQARLAYDAQGPALATV